MVNILQFSSMGWRIYTFFIFTFLIILPTLMSPPPIKVSGPVSNNNIQNCVQNNYSSVDFLEVSNLYDFLNESAFKWPYISSNRGSIDFLLVRLFCLRSKVHREDDCHRPLPTNLIPY